MILANGLALITSTSKRRFARGGLGCRRHVAGDQVLREFGRGVGRGGVPATFRAVQWLGATYWPSWV
jgi:hypothetical protein